MRLLAVSMEQRLGQKLIIEAKPGAGGNIGTQEVARAAPDGYTLLVAATNNFVINQFVMQDDVRSADDAGADRQACGRSAGAVLQSGGAGANTRGVHRLRARPTARSNYGVPGLGTVNHLLMERLKQTTGVDISLVPYRGSPQATLALLKNDIQLFPIGLAAVGGNLEEGKVTALAVATEKRMPMLPDVPTMAKAGFPGFVASNWLGMAAPAGTPDEILDTLAGAVAEAQKSALVTERFTKLGILVPELPRPQFAASLKTEAALWHETVQRGKITIE